MSQQIKSSKTSDIRKPRLSSSSDAANRRKGDVDTIIGKYRFVRTLGKGNFAKVNLAKHIPTDHLVAIKVIDKTQLSKTGLDKLYREVKILERMDHPNIVKLYEVIDRDNTLYLVMEYLSGGEIFDYLVAHGRMKERDARAKFRQIVSAVQYCHQRFVVHRDLKAENLLLDHNLNVKLADFGFSNDYCPGKKLDTFCGSPPYAAPELFRGERYTGPEVDVWSLGVILFTLVSGSLPFDGQNLKEVREKVLCGRFRIPFFMSTECEMLIKKLMVHNPSKRPPLDVVMNDKWINSGYDQDKLTPFVEPPERKLDEESIAKLTKMGYSRSQVIESVETPAFDEIAATYNILQALKKSSHPERSPRTLSHNNSVRVSRVSTPHRGVTPTEEKSRTLKPPPTNPSVCSQIRGSNRPIQRNGGYLRSSVYTPKRAVDSPRVPTQSFRIPSRPSPDHPRSSATIKTTQITRNSTLVKPESAKPFKPVRASFISRIKGTRKVSTENEKPRALKFTWSMKTSSLLPPAEIMSELTQALGKCRIEFEQTSKYVLLCVSGNVSEPDKFVQFESEICQLPRVGLHGVKFKRVNGSSIAFKQVGQLVTNTLKL